MLALLVTLAAALLLGTGHTAGAYAALTAQAVVVALLGAGSMVAQVRKEDPREQPVVALMVGAVVFLVLGLLVFAVQLGTAYLALGVLGLLKGYFAS